MPLHLPEKLLKNRAPAGNPGLLERLGARYFEWLRYASRWRVLMADLLYRAKIAATNALLKYGLSRVLGRSILRVSVA